MSPLSSPQVSRPIPFRVSTTSHCIPCEPISLNDPRPESPRSGAPSLVYASSSDELEDHEERPPTPRPRRASTKLIASNAADVRRITGQSTTRLIEKCCGGGCCMSITKQDHLSYERVTLPDNDAYRALRLNISDLLPTTLSGVVEMPPKTAEFVALSRHRADEDVDKPTPPTEVVPENSGEKVETTSQTHVEPQQEQEITQLQSETQDQVQDEVQSQSQPQEQAQDESQSRPQPSPQSTDFTTPHPDEISKEDDTLIHPPSFMQPHPPYHVFSAPVFSVRQLTKPGAEKRTYHFDLDVTHYPEETGIDFRVGGAIGVTPPNDTEIVDELFDLLLIPRSLRDRPVILKTSTGRWPTVWGDDKARELKTTRRALVTWASDIQSYPPNKPLLRLMAEYADDENESKILKYLCSYEGQGAFCEFRTGPNITVNHLLAAFPSAKPPLDHLLSVLQPLMARFYSLSSDPMENCVPIEGCHRVIEIAVTVHEAAHWRGYARTGVGSGYFERQALKWLEAEKRGERLDLRIPIFKGLMANPLAREFKMDGPMLLIGAGVGVAPFRGFVQRRLKTANCVNKVWVLQGIRDSLLDELYSGDWGVHEDEIKKVVQSRRGESRYVQEEVKNQAELVWWIINTIDGRIFVCGSTKGMGEGVEAALVDVAMERGNLSREEAEEFWRLKKESGSYIAETW